MAFQPTNLMPAKAWSSGSTLTSDTITPTANGLLMVVGSVTGTQAACGAISISSTTLTGMGSWTYYQSAVTASSQATTFIAVAQCGSSPGSGTVTVTFGATPADARIVVDEVAAGFNTSTPIAGSITGNAGTTASTPSLTLSATPTSSDIVYGAFGCRNAAAPFGVGGGFTAFDSSTGAANPRASIFTEWKKTTNTTVNAFGLGTSYNSGVGIIIKTSGGGTGSAVLDAVGSAPASATTSASPTSTQEFVGTTAATGGATGSPTATQPAAGTAAAVSGVTGDAGGINPAAGTVAATATTSGTATATQPAVGTAPAVATTTASPLALQAAQGTAPAVATSSLTATAVQPAAGTVTALSTASGAAAGLQPVSGTAAASSGVTATASALQPAAGTAAAVSTTRGSAIPLIAGAITCFSTTSGTATVTQPASGVAAAHAATVASAGSSFDVYAAPSRATSTAYGSTSALQPAACSPIVAVSGAYGWAFRMVEPRMFLDFDRFVIGDTVPVLSGLVVNSSQGGLAGSAGASAELHIARPYEANNQERVIIRTVPIGADGGWEMPWRRGDLDTPGSWEVEVQVTYADGDAETFGPKPFTVATELA